MDQVALIKQFTPGAAGIWVGVLMFVIYFIREWNATRKLSADDKLARRDGYAKQVEGLQAENRGLRADLATLFGEHESYRKLCHDETDQLRKQVRTLSDEIAGFRRAIMAGYLIAVEESPIEISEFVAAASKRAAEYLSNVDDGSDKNDL